jgi:acyl carrier protein
VAPVQQKMIELIAEKLGVQKDLIKMNSTFQEDLGADSLDVVEFIMDLEDKFGVTVPDQEAERFKTVADVVDYVVQHRAQ